MKAKIEKLLFIITTCLLTGCASNSDEKTQVVANPTFNRDIAPIIFNNCSSCHHEGGAGPFALTSYEQVKSHASEVKTVTSERIMPPWKAQPGWGDFENYRRLSDTHIKTIAAWVDQGAPQGEGVPPAVPIFKDHSENTWTLGKPDLVFKVAQPFSIPATGPDINRCFVIPTNVKEDLYVSAIEIQPSNQRVTHHCIVFLDSSGSARQLDALDPLEGYAVFGDPGFIPAGGLGSWSAANFERPLPKGVVRIVKKGSDIVLDTHFHPTGKPEVEQTTIGLYLSKEPVEHVVVRVSLSKFDFKVNPGAADHQIWTGCTMPVDFELLGFSPHSHYLCKEIKAWALPPNKEAQKLIYIKNFDFNKQAYYQNKKPVEFPKGTKIRAEFVFDNSHNNFANPNNPPRKVFFGPRTVDEMPILWYDVVAKNEAERPKLLEFLKRGRQFIYKTSW